MYIDYINDDPDIQSILEIGPGEMIEYPTIKEIRPIDYNVIEISKSFSKFISNTFPEVTILDTTVEKFVNPERDYDLVRVCDVFEHTSPVDVAIKNVVSSAKKFHITLFKWSAFDGDLVAEVKKDSAGVEYYSSCYPITLLINEILRYGNIETMGTIDSETGKYVSLGYMLDGKEHRSGELNSKRGRRLVITGSRYPSTSRGKRDVVENECDAEAYNQFWLKNPKYNSVHPYMQPMIELMLDFCPIPSDVLEVGAGFGRMAEMIIKEFKPKSYTAYEFSDSIDVMRELLSKSDYFDCIVTLIKDTFRGITRTESYDCVVAAEVFEHINWDLEFIEGLKSDTWVFFSVPTQYSKFHVRFFDDEQEIHDRFDELLDIRDIVFVPEKWFCVASKRR